MLVFDELFPCGEIIDDYMTATLEQSLMNEYNLTGKFSKIGVYTVNIDQSVLKIQGKSPYRCYKFKGSNNWSSENDDVIYQKNIFMSTYSIKELLFYGCKVEFVIGGRFVVREGTIENIKLFEHLLEFMEMKIREDQKPDEEQNDALRAFSKIVLNASAGKEFEHVHDSAFTVVMKHDYYSFLTRTKDMLPHSQTVVGYLNDEKIIVQYKKKPESILNIKSVDIGMYVYEISRAYMYKHIIYPLGHNKSLYMDTDAMKNRHSDSHLYLDRMKLQLIPHNAKIEEIDPRYRYHKMYEEGSKIFGSFANELPSDNNLLFINGKKEWACFNINNMDIIWAKFRLKGIRTTSLVVDIHNEEFMNCLRFIDVHPYVASQELAHRYDCSHEDLHLSLPNNVLKVFDTLNRGRDVWFLVSNFKRLIEHSGVAVIYSLKRISSNKS
jgi:hypothetical protein